MLAFLFSHGSCQKVLVSRLSGGFFVLFVYRVRRKIPVYWAYRKITPCTRQTDTWRCAKGVHTTNGSIGISSSDLPMLQHGYIICYLWYKQKSLSPVKKCRERLEIKGFRDSTAFCYRASEALFLFIKLSPVRSVAGLLTTQKRLSEE